MLLRIDYRSEGLKLHVTVRIGILWSLCLELSRRATGDQTQLQGLGAVK